MFSIKPLEETLATHFAHLADIREEGRVFLIEHGLGRDELDALLLMVGERATRHGFGRKAWDDFPFSLCVAMTEFGYGYSGNDYWPTAERGLKTEIRIDERAAISGQFRRLHRSIGIAAPLEDSWSDAFGHIAWPVRNAIVPKEIHASIARIIREALRHTQTMRADTQFLSLIRSLARGMNSRRLDSWLSDEALAIAVVRSLIADDMTMMGMDSPFLSRLRIDLRANNEYRHLEFAVRLRKATQNAGPLRLPQARLQLVLRDADPIGIAVRGPKLGIDQKHLLREKFGVLPTKAEIQFGTKKTTLEAFMAGEILFLGRPAKIPEPALSGLSEQPRELIEAVSPPERLLFLDRGDDGLQPQLDANLLPQIGHGFYELRLPSAVREDWSEHLYHFVAGEKEGDERLKAHGLLSARSPLIRFQGGLTLTQSGNEWQQSEGQPVFFQATESETRLSIRSMENASEHVVQLRDDAWFSFPHTSGSYRLEVANSEREDIITLSFYPRAPTDAVVLELHPDRAALSDIACGNASIALRAPINLDDAMLKFSLIPPSGEEVQVEMAVAEVPCVIGLDAEQLAPIREAARQWALSGAAARLNVEAIGLDERTWLLAGRPQVWAFHASDTRWVGEDGISVPSLIADPELDPIQFTTNGRADVKCAALITPATESETRVFSGVVSLEAKSFRLGGFRMPDLLRVSRAPASNGSQHGIIRSAEALVAWKVAHASTQIADSLRKQSAALVEDSLIAALCGDNWLKWERRYRVMAGGFHRRLAVLACERQLAMDDEDSFTPLPPEYVPLLQRCLETRLHAAFPDPKMIFPPDEEYWEDLDDVLYGAWDDLLLHVDAPVVGTLECFGKCPVGPWNRAIEDARQMTRLPNLAKWLLPESRRIGLVEFGYEAATFADLVAEIELGHHDLHRTGARWITPADIRALLLLFLDPAQLSDEPEWRGRIARFGSDQFSARAVRYAALRKNALRQRQPQ